MKLPLEEPLRNAKNGRFAPPTPEEAMARKAYPGGWHIYHKKGCTFKPWKAENGIGKRIRIGFATEKAAVTFVTENYALSPSESSPLSMLTPDRRQEWTILRTLAGKLQKGEAADVQAWNSVIQMDDLTLTTVHMMIPRIINCKDQHKPTTMTKALFDKLESTRSNFTVKQMVDARLNVKSEKNKYLKSEREKRRAFGHFEQVVEVGNSLLAFFSPDDDIDSISQEDMKLWSMSYLDSHKFKDGSKLADSTMEARKGIAASFFKEAMNQGWPGRPPIKPIVVGNDFDTVILNFDEVSGILIALRYLNPRACLAFAIELYGLLRTGESLWLRRKDIRLEDKSLTVEVPKLDSNHANRNRKTKKCRVQIIDALFQWIMYLSTFFDDYLWSEVLSSPYEGSTEFQGVMEKARKIANCMRWNHKDNGRHTGTNVYDKMGVHLTGVKAQLRHALGTSTAEDCYLRDMDEKDAAAVLLITPANLGWISEAYPYEVPAKLLGHLGHYLQLDPTRKDHRAVMDEYIPKLRARDAEIRSILKLK